MLHIMKKIKIITKHVYSSIIRGQLLLNYISVYLCIYWQVFSKYKFRKYDVIIEKINFVRTITELVKSPQKYLLVAYAVDLPIEYFEIVLFRLMLAIY